MAYSVTQNTFFFTSASILQKIISFVYFTLIARLIGVENTGQYFFAIAFTTIFTVIADFGLSPTLTREAAKFPERSNQYVNTLFWAKIIFGCLAYFLIFGSVNILGYPGALKKLVYLSGLTMFFDNLQTVFYSIFRAHRNLMYESIGSVSSQLVTLGIGTVALIKHWPLIWLIAAYTIPSGLSVIYAAIFARRLFNLHYQCRVDKKIFYSLMQLAIPFALAGFIGRLYSYADTVLMSKLLTPEHLGWWSVPYKITFAFQFIPAALSASVYPVMSSLGVSHQFQVSELFIKAWRYLFLIILPLSSGLIALSGPIIIKLYGVSYAPSIIVLRLLLLSLIFTFLSFISGALLNALNQQKTQTTLLAIALVINLICNSILMPRYGVTGAAWSALIASVVLWGGGYYFSSRTVVIHHRDIWNFFGQVFWPAVVMGMIVYFAAERVHFFFAILLGAIIYLVFLFLSGAFSKEIINKYYSKIVRGTI